MNLDWRIASQNSLYSVYLLCALFFGGCGKKDKHIFSLQQEQKRKRLPVFIMPLVENISLSRTQEEITITWNALADSLLYKGERLSLCGYNVYSFESSSFIPKKALFTSECSYKDKSNKMTTYYTVRGVYTLDGRHIEGPNSKIISTSVLGSKT